jgi:hypothetical protein
LFSETNLNMRNITTRGSHTRVKIFGLNLPFIKYQFFTLKTATANFSEMSAVLTTSAWRDIRKTLHGNCHVLFHHRHLQAFKPVPIFRLHFHPSILPSVWHVCLSSSCRMRVKPLPRNSISCHFENMLQIIPLLF